MSDQSRPVPRASAFDPDALDLDHLDLASWQVEAIRDRVLALVRPVEGLLLTPEEIGVLDSVIVRGGFNDSPEDQALAARIEALS